MRMVALSRMAKQAPFVRMQPRSLAQGIGVSILYVFAAIFLSSCMLMSGKQELVDSLPGSGNISTSFISAEGVKEGIISVGTPSARVNVIMWVQVQQGEIRLELLDAADTVALSIQSRPGEQITKVGEVLTDAQGQLPYRITAQGARDGSYEVLYQVVP